MPARRCKLASTLQRTPAFSAVRLRLELRQRLSGFEQRLETAENHRPRHTASAVHRAIFSEPVMDHRKPHDVAAWGYLECNLRREFIAILPERRMKGVAKPSPRLTSKQDMFIHDHSVSAVKDFRSNLPIRFDARAAIPVSSSDVRVCERIPDFIWGGRDVGSHNNAWPVHNLNS